MIEIFLTSLVVSENGRILTDKVFNIEGDGELSAAIDAQSNHDDIDYKEDNTANLAKNHGGKVLSEATLSAGGLEDSFHGGACTLFLSFHAGFSLLGEFDVAVGLLLVSGADTAAAYGVGLATAKATDVATLGPLLLDTFGVPNDDGKENGHNSQVQEDDAQTGKEAE